MSENLVIRIGGMSCNHCKMSVEKAVKSLDGVEDVAVDLKESSATVRYNPEQVSKEQLEQVIDGAGYEVVK